MATPYRLNNRPNSAHSLIASLVPPSTDVLDVGCNRGYLAAPLRQKGCRCWGLDRDEEAIRQIPSGLYDDIRVFDANHAEFPFPNQTFEIIVLADVLEHVVDPGTLLHDLRSRLRPNGLVIVSLPNVAHISVRLALAVGRFTYKESGILDRTHLHFYTLRTAQKFIADAGFSVTSQLSATDHFSRVVNARWGRPLRGLLTYNIVIQASPR